MAETTAPRHPHQPARALDHKPPTYNLYTEYYIAAMCFSRRDASTHSSEVNTHVPSGSNRPRPWRGHTHSHWAIPRSKITFPPSPLGKWPMGADRVARHPICSWSTTCCRSCKVEVVVVLSFNASRLIIAPNRARLAYGCNGLDGLMMGSLSLHALPLPGHRALA